MVVFCSIVECSVGSRSRSLFKMPKDPVIRRKWSDFLSASGKQVYKNVQYVVCENHFLPTDFKQCKKLQKA